MQKPIILQYSYVNRAVKDFVLTMRRIPRMVIMIHYAPDIQIYTLFMKRNETLKLLKIIHVMQH